MYDDNILMPADEPAPGTRDNTLTAEQQKLLAAIAGRTNRISLADLMTKDIKPTEWLVDGLVPAEGITVLGGGVKEGKSYFAQNLALAVATGADFLGRKTKKTAVEYIELDHPNEADFRARFAVMAGGPVPRNIYYDTAPEGETFPRLLEKPYDAVDVFRAIRLRTKLEDGIDIGLIIVDVYALIVPDKVGGRTAYEEGYKETAKLTRFCADEHVAVILIHHTKKESSKTRTSENPFDALSGSNSLFATSTAGIVLRRPFGAATTEMWTRSTKAKADGHYNIQLTDTGRYIYLGDATAAAEKAAETAYLTDPSRRLLRDVVDRYETITGRISDIIEAGESITGTAYPYTPKRLSMWISVNEERLWTEDGIQISYRAHGKQYTINRVPEVEELPDECYPDDDIDPDQPF